VAFSITDDADLTGSGSGGGIKGGAAGSNSNGNGSGSNSSIANSAYMSEAQRAAAQLMARQLAAAKEASDLELIQQLARAEGGLEDFDEYAADDRTDDDISKLLAAHKQGAGGGGLATSELTSELLALEALEKELGLDDLKLYGHSASASAAGSAYSSPAPGAGSDWGFSTNANTHGSPGVTPHTPSPTLAPGGGSSTPSVSGEVNIGHAEEDDEDDFDELEHYLESLSVAKN